VKDGPCAGRADLRARIAVRGPVVNNVEVNLNDEVAVGAKEDEHQHQHGVEHLAASASLTSLELLV